MLGRGGTENSEGASGKRGDEKQDEQYLCQALRTSELRDACKNLAMHSAQLGAMMSPYPSS